MLELCWKFVGIYVWESQVAGKTPPKEADESSLVRCGFLLRIACHCYFTHRRPIIEDVSLVFFFHTSPKFCSGHIPLMDGQFGNVSLNSVWESFNVPVFKESSARYHGHSSNWWNRDLTKGDRGQVETGFPKAWAMLGLCSGVSEYKHRIDPTWILFKP